VIKPYDYSILDAKRTTHIETPIGEANHEGDVLTSKMEAHQLQTYYIKFKDTLRKKIKQPR